MTSLITVGESLGLVFSHRSGGFDLVPDAAVSFGGAESNVAIAAARLGCASGWVGRLGEDAIGRLILRGLLAERVTPFATIDDDVPTALMLKDRPRPGRSRVTYYRRDNAGSRMTPADLPLEAIDGARVLHITGISMALGETARDTVRAAVARARQAGVVVSFDINHRSRLWTGDSAHASYRELIEVADVVFAGAEEAALVVGAGDPRSQAERLHALGPGTAVIKLGEDGAYGIEGEEHVRQEAFPVQVADTVGAGDAFVAGFLTELIHGAPLAQKMRTAAASGACACRGYGDWESMPYPADIRDLVVDEARDHVER